MTADTNDPRAELNKITRQLADDLFNTPEAEIIQEAAKDESLKAAGIAARSAYQKAIQTVGASRLQAAREAIKSVNNQPLSETRNIDALTAHRIISQLTASNDPRLTLAARNLNNISDEEAIEVVVELVELGALDKDAQF